MRSLALTLALLLGGCEITIHRGSARDADQRLQPDASDSPVAESCRPCDPPCQSWQTCVDGSCWDKAIGS